MNYIRVSGQIDEKFSGETPAISDDTPLTKGVSKKDSYFHAYQTTNYQIEAHFKQRGWIRLDAGNYATVYEHPEQPGKVLKVFKWDPAYVRFWAIAKNSDNPHFPEVSRMGTVSIPITVKLFVDAPPGPRSPIATPQRMEDKPIDATMFVVLVEKLAPLAAGLNSDYSWLKRIQEQSKGYLNGSGIEPDITKKFPLLTFALDLIREAKYKNAKTRWKYSVDLHPGNMMIRDGNFPVITDPFS